MKIQNFDITILCEDVQLNIKNTDEGFILRTSQDGFSVTASDLTKLSRLISILDNIDRDEGPEWALEA